MWNKDKQVEWSRQRVLHYQIKLKCNCLKQAKSDLIYIWQFNKLSVYGTIKSLWLCKSIAFPFLLCAVWWYEITWKIIHNPFVLKCAKSWILKSYIADNFKKNAYFLYKNIAINYLHDNEWNIIFLEVICNIWFQYPRFCTFQ
jgi:hypothetical protein